MGVTSLASFQLSILPVDTPVPTVLDVFFGHDTMTSSLSTALATERRTEEVVLESLLS